eukprot:jgi/Orpsp1_1/1187339/evm.model.d7180000057002.1
MLQTRRHHPYLYVPSSSAQRYSCPVPQSQQYYYHQAKTSSYPGISNHTNSIPNLSSNEVNINSALINPINNTLSTKKSNNFNSEKYSSQTVVNNFVNMPVNNNNPLTMNSMKYITTPSSLPTLNLNTSNINTNVNDGNYNALISPVLTNQTVLYPTSIVQSPNEGGITTPPTINTPTLR